MIVISIGSDRNIFKEGSDVYMRTCTYATFFDEIHIIVFSKKNDWYQPIRIGENIWVYPTNSVNRVMYIFDAFKIGKSLCRKIHDAVITTQDPFEAGLVGMRLSRLFSFPLHVQIHTDFLSLYFKKSCFLNYVRTYIARFVIPHAKRIRTVSTRIKDVLIEMYHVPEERISILPIALQEKEMPEEVSSLRWDDVYNAYDKVFIMASRLTKEKDIYTAIDAVARVVSRYPRTGLFIFGDGSEKEKLLSYIQKKGLSSVVRIFPWQASLNEQYQRAYAFLLTSRFEGYARTLLEAGINHCPAISTDVGLVGSVLHDRQSVVVCSVGDVQCIAEQMMELMTDKELHSTLASGTYHDASLTVVPFSVYAKKYYEDILQTVRNI